VRGNTDTGTGAWGFANSGVGVRGESSTGDGVSGRAAASNRSGVYGYNSGSGYGVAGRSVSGWGIEADGNDVYAVVHQIDENGTKSAILQTESYGQRAVYTMESPEVWLEDLGSGSLVDGVATVAFEPIFAETVNLEVNYHVFVTPLCQEPVLLFVTAKDTSGFTVRGVTLDGQPAACGFDYRVVGKRLGLEDIRLEPLEVSAGGK